MLRARRVGNGGFGRIGPRAWRNGLRSAIYIPNELSAVQTMLSDGRVFDSCAELWRLSQLGSDQATAVLAFMYFRGITWGEVPEKTISESCRQAAIRGNSYAQYVMALSECRRADYTQEWTWLKLSNKQKFGPSLAESARIAVRIVGKPKLALPYFKRGIQAWHLPSLMFFISSCIKGSYGWIWRVLGILSYPIAMSVMSIAFRYFPFSQNVFAHLPTTDGPLHTRG